MEYMIVNIANEKYAFSVKIIQEIKQKSSVTVLQNEAKHIDGIVSWRDAILKLINLRSILGFKTYPEEQIAILEYAEHAHNNWMESLLETIQEGKEFNKQLDYHSCTLGRWIDDMQKCIKCNNDGFLNIIRDNLIGVHTLFHKVAQTILETFDKDEKLRIYNNEIVKIHQDVLEAIAILKSQVRRLASAFERMIVCKIEDKFFALVVDDIEEIVSLEESDIFSVSMNDKSVSFRYGFKRKDKVILVLEDNQILSFL